MSEHFTIPNHLAGPVLLFTGGSHEDRQRLLRQLNSAGIGYRLVGQFPELLRPGDDGESDVSEFFQDFNDRLLRMTEKELLVLQRILAGQTNKSISQQLELTERAVELRKASIMRKLEASSHTELIRLTTKFETLKNYLLRQLREAPVLRGDTQGDAISGRRLDTAHHANDKEISPDRVGV